MSTIQGAEFEGALLACVTTSYWMVWESYPRT